MNSTRRLLDAQTFFRSLSVGFFFALWGNTLPSATSKVMRSSLATATQETAQRVGKANVPESSNFGHTKSRNPTKSASGKAFVNLSNYKSDNVNCLLLTSNLIASIKAQQLFSFSSPGFEAAK